MTRDDILNMTAGRQVDALIISKVMGWKFAVHNADKYFSKPDKTGNIWVVPYGDKNSFGNWSPSTDIAAAWEVTDKINRMIAENILELENDYNYLTLECVGYTSGYAASFDCLLDHEWFEDITNYKYAARADTAPLAICRAALLAVMEAE